MIAVIRFRQVDLLQALQVFHRHALATPTLLFPPRPVVPRFPVTPLTLVLCRPKSQAQSLLLLLPTSCLGLISRLCRLPLPLLQGTLLMLLLLWLQDVLLSTLPHSDVTSLPDLQLNHSSPHSEFGSPSTDRLLDNALHKCDCHVNDGRFSNVGHGVLRLEGRAAQGVWLRIWDSSQGRRARLRLDVLNQVGNRSATTVRALHNRTHRIGFRMFELFRKIDEDFGGSRS